MLKITPVCSSPVHLTLRLEGRVVGPWVDVLWTSCGEALASYDRVTLDLSEVWFVDAAGVSALHEIDPERVRMRGCKGFIAQMLKEVRS
jgi:ABC-type transporter Mla MlaB component